VLFGASLVACRDRNDQDAAQVAVPASSAPAAPATRAVLVAKRGTPILDGKLDQPVWHQAARSAPFVDELGQRPVPHTEARASWDDSALYLELYVADDELRATDHVSIMLDGGLSVHASPAGTLTCTLQGVNDCAALGIRSGLDVDGDVDLDLKEDEEWSVTVALPWRTIAPQGRPGEVAMTLRRSDSSNGRPVREIWSRGSGVVRLAAE
jgi:hypothetical protein